MIHRCQHCGAEFDRPTKNPARARYCSFPCYNVARKGVPNGGAFAPGQTPWNKGMTGLHLSPATEFKPGRRPVSWVSVGTVRIREDKNGTPRAWIKTAEPNQWTLRAVYVWEREHKTEVPEGCVVHHRDFNSMNDDPENLQALTRAQHIEVHRRQLQQSKRRK